MKKKTMKYLVMGIILLITFPIVYADELTINSPNYFDEQDNTLNEISFLNNEILSFEVCKENGENFQAKYYCSESEQNGTFSLTNNAENSCAYDNSKLSEIPCDEFRLEVTFQQDNRERVITRDFSKTKESVALTSVLDNEIEQLSPLEKSYYLLLHSSIKGNDNQKANDLYDQLKNSRDNEKKCWPQDNQCDVTKTAKILYNVKLSGYEMDSRLLEDGKTYLESLFISQNKIQYDENDENFEIAIQVEDEFQDDISCTLLNDDNEEEYTFENSDELEDLTNIETVENSVEFSCEEEINSINYILSNDITQKSQSDSNELSYTIPNSQKEDYGFFETKIEFADDFSNGETTCDITIDDEEEQEYEFTNQSSKNDLAITKTLQDEIQIDCNNDVNYIRALIFAGENQKEQYSNEDEFSFVIDELLDKQYNFEIHFDYDFSKQTLTCDLKRDNKNSLPLEFEQGDELNVTQFSASSSFSFQCDDTLDEITSYVKDDFGRYQLEKQETSSSKITNSIPNSFSQYECLGKDSTCSEETTLFTLMTYDEIENQDDLSNYVSSLIQKREDFPLIETQRPYENAGKFLHIKENEELIESLKFLQNNDGSWSNLRVGEKLIPTAWVKMGLNEHQSSEHITDGEKWIYENEPENGWDSISKNSLAYLAIKDKVKPYLTIEPIDSITSMQNITITNPTIFNLENLKVKFSDSLKNKFSYKENLGELSQNQKLNFSLKPRNVQEKITGDIIISGFSNEEEMELIKMPLSVEQSFPFSVEKTSYSFTQDDKEISIPIIQNSKSNYSYQCEISSEVENKKTTITQNTNEIILNNSQEIQGNTNLKIKCEKENKEKIFEKEITLEKIKKTFEVDTNKLLITDTNEKIITISNKGDGQKIINFKISEELRPYLLMDKSNTALAENQSEEIIIEINETAFEQASSNITGNLNIDDSNNYEKQLPIIITKDTKQSSGFGWIIWTIVILLGVGFALLIVIRYKQLQEENSSTNQYNQEGEEEVILE